MKYDRKPFLVCPKCSSPKIYPSSVLDGWLTPEKYLCGRCGYKGSIIMKIEKEEYKAVRDSNSKTECK